MGHEIRAIRKLILGIVLSRVDSVNYVCMTGPRFRLSGLGFRKVHKKKTKIIFNLPFYWSTAFFLTLDCGVTIGVSSRRIFFDIGSCTGGSSEI
ncbi:hypothetical protein BpHYR1_009591 [Brachionus plicatilis]|uniref:Uncharacterized protein n=1 Tax=Brachionus plicatilis TaxID=10195 RepID=A0A3M7T5K6_BRAPC|nr:hypothetical protein BpHYR1_009591 [Brachionus plicatilis]